MADKKPRPSKAGIYNFRAPPQLLADFETRCKQLNVRRAAVARRLLAMFVYEDLDVNGAGD